MSTKTSVSAQATRKSVSARALAVLVGLFIATTALIAAPPSARADGADDAFINALNGSGIVFDNAEAAKTVAHAICPSLAKGGKSVAWNYAKIQGNMPPAMAATFTAIAVRSYCPGMLRNLMGN
jgi:hypothetical protein